MSYKRTQITKLNQKGNKQNEKINKEIQTIKFWSKRITEIKKIHQRSLTVDMIMQKKKPVNLKIDHLKLSQRDFFFFLIERGKELKNKTKKPYGTYRTPTSRVIYALWESQKEERGSGAEFISRSNGWKFPKSEGGNIHPYL